MGHAVSAPGNPAAAGAAIGAAGSAEATAEVLLRWPAVRWSGWGCSLAWLGKALGSTAEAEAWADLLFTSGDVSLARLWPAWVGPYMPQTVPGLGINIARYNVGGTGRVEDQSGEARSSKSRGWHAEIEGFQPSPGSEFDWSRDEGQRRFLGLAVERGVDQVEFFSNAPMWWMSHTASSFGGTLARPDEFAAYLAEVAAHARSAWGVPVRSVAPFNEPLADWWRFPHDQEGCRVNWSLQARLIARLRDELDRRGLGDVLVAASDENRPSEAGRTWLELRRAGVTGYIGCLNVHSYDGVEPWREAEHPGHRGALCRLAADDHVPIWVSEHGNGDPSGVALAQTILEDLHHLKPTAWNYWQPVEHRSPWGFVEANFTPTGTTPLGLPHAKYYVFAHFSRFIRRGFVMLHVTEPWAAAAYSPEESSVACVVVNPAPLARTLRLRLSTFATKAANGGGARGLVTEPQARRVLVNQPVKVVEAAEDGLEISVVVPGQAVCSVVVPEVRPIPGTCDVEPGSPSRMQADPPMAACDTCGITAARVQAMARCAARGAADERCFGAADARTKASWIRWEHECGRAAVALGALPPVVPAPGSGFGDLVEIVCSGAWGAANERKFGSGQQKGRDAEEAWGRFHAHAEQLAQTAAHEKDVAKDLQWMVFNTCWAVVNEIWYGAESADCRDAARRAEEHLVRLGASRIILRRCA